MNTNIHEVEERILGLMLISEDARILVSEILRAEHFSREPHQAIFRAILRLVERNEPVDYLTANQELERTGDLERAGGRVRLIELTEDVVDTGNTNTEYFARQVLEQAVRRQLYDSCRRIAQQTKEAGVETAQLVDEAEQTLHAVAENHSPQRFTAAADIVGDVLADAERIYKNPETCIGIPTGFADLDRLICGLESGLLYVIAGRPGMGKTAMAMNIAQYAAASGTPTGIFSLEMPQKQLLMRMICSSAPVGIQEFRTGRCNKKEFTRAVQTGSRIVDLPLYIDDSSALSSQQIHTRAKRLKRQKDIGLLVVDYLQLVREKISANQEHQVALASGMMKAIAKELEIPVITLSQLNRVSEQGNETRRPRLSDLRYSGAIEQDADVVLFIYRPEQYRPGDQPGIAEIIIGKQRNGPTDTVKLTFRKEFVRFENHTTAHTAGQPGKPRGQTHAQGRRCSN